MNRHATLHATLAAVGCASLLVYVLACQQASFSPDDSQVLYPAFDLPGGAESVAVYDRQTGRSESIFAAIPNGRNAADGDLGLIRAQWLPDGKHVLVAHIQPNHDKEISLLVLPHGVAEAVRTFDNLELAADRGMALFYPLPIVGKKVYLCGEKLNSIDLVSGQVSSADNTTNHIILLPGGDGTTIVAVAQPNKGEGADGSGMEFGTLDPQTLAFRVDCRLTNDFAEGVFPTFSPRTHQVVFVAGDPTNLELQVATNASVCFRRTLARGSASQWLGPWLNLGPRHDRAFASYISQAENSKDAEYGVVEIPFNREPLRWIPLFRAAPKEPKNDLLFAQASLSHDGQTWAMATSQLPSSSIQAADRALYLVDVAQATPKITKVPIAMPADRKDRNGN